MKNTTIKLCKYFNEITGYCGNPQRLITDSRHTFQGYNGQIICDYRGRPEVMSSCAFSKLVKSN